MRPHFVAQAIIVEGGGNYPAPGIVFCISNDDQLAVWLDSIMGDMNQL